MASVLNDIKNNKISEVYLFYGEEAFKRRNYKEQLKKTVLNGNTMNFSQFTGKDIDWQAVYDAVVTMPFFADKRLVIVENSGKFKAKKGKDEGETEDDKAPALLEKILNDKPSSTCLAFFEESAAKNKKVFKMIASKGVTCECNADTEEDVINWLARGFAHEGKKVRKSTLMLLTGRIGLEYDRLRGEFEKIVSYVGDREIIEDQDILDITSETIESKIFELMDAVSEKNRVKMLDRYYDMLANKEAPAYILAMLRGQFRIMLQIGELADSGMNSYEISKSVGRPNFAVNKNLKFYRSFGRERVIRILDEISEIDKKYKSGDIQDQIGLELLLIEFSS